MTLTVDEDLNERTSAVGATVEWLDRADGRRRAWFISLMMPAVVGPMWVVAWSQTGHTSVRPWETIAGFVLVAAVLTAATTDLLWRRIPNWITYSAACWGILLATYVTISKIEDGQSRVASIGIGNSLFGGAALFFVAWLIFSITQSGAGDVKLAAAIGALVGPGEGMDVMMYSFVVAGFSILGWSILRFGPTLIVVTLGRSIGHFFFPRFIEGPSERQRRLMAAPVPLAPFFAVGAIWAFGDAHWTSGN